MGFCGACFVRRSFYGAEVVGRLGGDEGWLDRYDSTAMYVWFRKAILCTDFLTKNVTFLPVTPSVMPSNIFSNL